MTLCALKQASCKPWTEKLILAFYFFLQHLPTELNQSQREKESVRSQRGNCELKEKEEERRAQTFSKHVLCGRHCPRQYCTLFIPSRADNIIPILMMEKMRLKELLPQVIEPIRNRTRHQAFPNHIHDLLLPHAA
jgi:hypothetical protein